MRPTRLELHNFLAYRDPAPLSFDGFDVACLSGPNGAGKSSLLDAITWALWGRSRAPANRADDMLIHLGQAEMWVQFEFRQEREKFRVRREYKRGKTNQSALQLYVWNEEREQWDSLTGQLRETQEKINQILRLDYSTFIESAFVQQGKADSFTQKSPSERKILLGTILGLAHWDSLERAARAKVDKFTLELHAIDGAISENASRDDDEAVRQANLDTARATLQTHQQEAELAQLAYQEIAAAPQHKAAAEKQYQAVEVRIKQAELALKSAQDDRTKHQATYDGYHSILQRQQEITASYAELEQARQIDSEQGFLLGKLNALERQHAALEKQLAQKRGELEAQCHIHMDRAQAAERLSSELSNLQQQAQGLERDFAEFEETEQKFRGQREQIRQSELESTQLATENRTLKEQMDEIAAKRDTIKAAEVCPLCGQPINDSHREHHVQQLNAEGKMRGDSYRANKGRLAHIEAEILALKTAAQQAEVQLKSFDKLKSDHGRLLERIHKAEEAELEAVRERELAIQLEARLEAGEYGGDLAQQIALTAAQISDVGYDSELHDSARQVLGELAGYDALQRKLEVAQTAIAAVQTTIDTITTQIETQHIVLQQERDSLAALEQNIRDLDAQVQSAERHRQTVNELRKKERDARDLCIRLEQEISAIVGARQRRQTLETDRERVNREIKMYGELRESFGKNGVQAMIIESAIPELEESANRLLHRMTDGRMSIRFDTQRSTKGGDTIETLDILISDELGQRSYDMFSGGEGFRINFALRIALSQLLARRAGARLQTLVIDEGFGSQDSVGRERIVEAINAIRGDFDLILIVTHIEELLELFPARIEVSKTATGSHAFVRG